MIELLASVRDTALKADVDAEPKKEHDSIYSTDSHSIIADKIIRRFKVGDFIEIAGTEALEEILAFPNWMELRIRCSSYGKPTVFYPKGWLVWNKIRIRKYGNQQFKCNVDEVNLIFKIWRSK